MGKRKLTDTQIIEISKSYANECDAVNMSYLSSKYKVSTTTISKAIHYAISESLITEAVANLIAAKAIRHDNIRRDLLKLSKSSKIADLYNSLINSRKKKEVTVLSVADLKAKLNELNYQYDIFEESYSLADEYPLSKRELELEISNLQEQINKIAGHI